jgi:hypothetical protein
MTQECKHATDILHQKEQKLNALKTQIGHVIKKQNLEDQELFPQNQDIYNQLLQRDKKIKVLR